MILKNLVLGGLPSSEERKRTKIRSAVWVRYLRFSGLLKNENPKIYDRVGFQVLKNRKPRFVRVEWASDLREKRNQDLFGGLSKNENSKIFCELLKNENPKIKICKFGWASEE
ncbi:unnamed protein product [Rhizophagus irregularis]|nr:unnamed protein product [Rhizophagus irregularis]